ncbi:unnamed protein product [Auanema sp. JU1783]|nr:unnamed protein product [Auanema sp. JU1783]
MEEENESFATTEEYAVEHLRVSVAHVLTNIGFSAINEESLNILVDISRRFMSSLCGKTKFYAEHAGRTAVTPCDLSLAFRRMQFSSVELYDYLDQVGTVPKFPVPLPKLLPILHPPPTREELMTRPEHIPMHYPRMWTPKKSLFCECYDLYSICYSDEDFLAVKAKKNPNSIPKFPDFTNSNAMDLNLARSRNRIVKRSPTPDAFISSGNTMILRTCLKEILFFLVREKILPEKQYEPPIIIEAPAGLLNQKKKKRDYNKKAKPPKIKPKVLPKKIEKSPQTPKKTKTVSSPVSAVKLEEKSKNVLTKNTPTKPVDSVSTPNSGSSNDSISNSEPSAPTSERVAAFTVCVDRYRGAENSAAETAPKTEKDGSDIEARYKRDMAEQAELEGKMQLQMLMEAKTYRPSEPSPPMRLEVSSTSADGLKIVISNSQRNCKNSSGRYSTNTTISPHSDMEFNEECTNPPIEEAFVDEGCITETPSPVYTYFDAIKPGRFSDTMTTLSMDADSFSEQIEDWPSKKHKKHKKEKKPKKEKEKKSHKKNNVVEKKSKTKKIEPPVEITPKSEHKIKLKIKLAEGQPSSTVCSFNEEKPPLPDSTVKLRIKLKEEKREDNLIMSAETERKVPKLKIGLPKSSEPVPEPEPSDISAPERSSRATKTMAKSNGDLKEKPEPVQEVDASTKPRKRKSSATFNPEKKRVKDFMKREKPKMNGKEPLTDNDDAKTVESADEEIWICPACSVAWTEGATMIGCDNCDNWFHWHCVNITEAPDEQQEWFCQKCKNKKMKKTNQSKSRRK